MRLWADGRNSLFDVSARRRIDSVSCEEGTTTADKDDSLGGGGGRGVVDAILLLMLMVASNSHWLNMIGDMFAAGITAGDGEHEHGCDGD